MSKKLNYYKDNVDYAWYDSSNIVYSECVDNENELKTLRIVFSNGSMYEYKNVHVMDYLVFREDASQGKALNRLIKEKGYEYQKIDSPNIDELNEKYDFIVNGGIYLDNSGEKFKVISAVGDILYEYDGKLDEKIAGIITGIFNSININYKII